MASRRLDLALSAGLLAATASAGHRAARPNVLFVLTDDQDITLGSLSVMPKLKSLITDQGAYFRNAFVNTPICCPSRSEIQTGRYMHNTKSFNNACGGQEFRNGPESQNMAHFAKNQGYTTWYSGKYLNNYGTESLVPQGTKYVPPGWDEWHALVGNSKYYNYEVSNNGNATPVKHGDDYTTDYYTDVLKNESAAWLKEKWEPSLGPFFMMIGTPCPHVPNIFAPQYSGLYRDVKAPRLPNWNVAPANATGPGTKHWFLQHIGPMDAQHVNNSDMTFQDRWRCLQSVDDLVEKLVITLKSKGQWENTYFIYSADHGQHLGEFGMGFDKRQLYETDIRVPLLVRGPGIEAGINTTAMASHVDLAVTFLDMMGASKPEIMDGTSWLPIIQGTTSERYQAENSWRHDLLIEYNGPSVPTNLAAARRYGAMTVNHEYQNFIGIQDEDTAARPTGTGNCGIPVTGHDIHVNCEGIGMCGGEHGSCPCDATNNTYKCLRTINATENSIFCQFDDDVNMTEYYDLNTDPYQLFNIAFADPAPDVVEKMNALSARLRDYMHCWGGYCFDPSSNIPPAPTPPPTPSPPPPALNVAHMFEYDGLCLTASADLGIEKDNRSPLTMTPCTSGSYNSAQAWDDITLVKEEMVVRSGLNLQCANLNDGAKACAMPSSETWFHLFQCPGGPGDRLHWNSTVGAIQLDSSVCSGHFCMGVSAVNSSFAKVQLSSCTSNGAFGWIRSNAPKRV